VGEKIPVNIITHIHPKLALITNMNIIAISVSTISTIMFIQENV